MCHVGKRLDSQGLEVAVTDLEHSHVVCKVKLVMSARRLYWGEGFTLAILRWRVFPLMQCKRFVRTFRESG
jgi:hypothetical protein